MTEQTCRVRAVYPISGTIKEYYSVFALSSSFTAAKADSAVVKTCNVRDKLFLPVFDNALMALIRCFTVVLRICRDLSTTGVGLRWPYL